MVRGLRSTPSITVRRLCRAPGVTRHELVRAVRLAAHDRPIRSLSLVLASDAVMAELHGRFMDEPTPTDVLTFDLRDDRESGSGAVDGEVIVSVETARREAKRRGLPGHQEVLRYLIHGTLHLIGYDDATPLQRRRMRREEDRILAEIAVENGKMMECRRPQRR